ncbi:MAG: hypothetical protein ACYCO3_14590 [Mycobacteriales bacterium]
MLGPLDAVSAHLSLDDPGCGTKPASGEQLAHDLAHRLRQGDCQGLGGGSQPSPAWPEHELLADSRITVIGPEQLTSQDGYFRAAVDELAQRVDSVRVHVDLDAHRRRGWDRQLSSPLRVLPPVTL